MGSTPFAKAISNANSLIPLSFENKTQFPRRFFISSLSFSPQAKGAAIQMADTGEDFWTTYVVVLWESVLTLTYFPFNWGRNLFPWMNCWQLWLHTHLIVHSFSESILSLSYASDLVLANPELQRPSKRSVYLHFCRESSRIIFDYNYLKG